MRETIQKRAPADLRQEAIGGRLKSIREAYGLKPSEIADKLGVERTYWSRWETGARPIPIDMAYALTQMFEVDLDYVLSGDLRAVPLDVRERLATASAS